MDIKVKLGQILFIIFAPITLACTLFAIFIDIGNVHSLQKYFWYIGGIGIAAAIPTLIGARIIDKSLKEAVKVHAIVVSRGDIAATDAAAGNVIFETERGKAVTLRMNMIDYNTLSENDVGILHYKPVTDKLTRFILKMLGHNKYVQENHFVKFEGEGKSANPCGTKADEQCKNCGALIHYSRFSSRISCEYCVDNGKRVVKSDRRKNPLLSKIGRFIMSASALLLAVCILTTMKLIGKPVLQRVSWHLVGFGFTTVLGWLIGASLWHNSLPEVKVRVFVEKVGKLGEIFGDIVFETEKKESVTLKVGEYTYKSISEGDVGILCYRLDEKNLKSFKKFEREGKSAVLFGAADRHCKKCGAAIKMEKYRYVATILCEYCGERVSISE